MAVENQKSPSVGLMDRLIWQPDRAILGDLVFRLEHYKSDNWDLGEECFQFYKIKKLVDQYYRYFSLHPDFQPRNIFELGIFDGGSITFWFEWFQPQKHIAVDLMTREDSEYFKRYINSRGLQERVSTFWGVDQADKVKIRRIAHNEFDAPIDLVIDDASHLYQPTKASFEALYPLLRPGGLYVIEDWAWDHWVEFQSPEHPWAAEVPLTNLINDLVAATGSSINLIASLTVYEGFVVIERGVEELSVDDFSLDRYIQRRRVLRGGQGLRHALSQAARSIKKRLGDQ